MIPKDRRPKETAKSMGDMLRDALKTSKDGEECECCGKFVEGFKYQMCCSGHECGCMGMPIEPCICSQECWDKMVEKGVYCG